MPTSACSKVPLSSLRQRRPRLRLTQPTFPASPPPPLMVHRALEKKDTSYQVGFGSYDAEMDGYVPADVSLATLKKGDKVGEGSFGTVFRASIVEDVEGGEQSREVIIKEYKKNVRGRDWFSFYSDERAICRRLVGCTGVAPFIGVAGSDAYLVWENIGETTLGAVMETGDAASEAALKAAAAAMCMESDTTDAAAFVSVARALCQATRAMHIEGVVHRDIKPDNVLLTSTKAGSPGGGVVLIDLGGAADFDTGQGCSGDEAIFDPVYGAPEQFTRTRKSGIAGGFAGLFGGGKGDAGLTATGAVPTEAFDAFGVGLLLLRLAVPALHPTGAMDRARAALDDAAERVEEEAAGRSVLQEWRAAPGSESCDFALLDKVGAWSLVEGLTQWDPEQRMTLSEALEHPALGK
uniref:Protein kinase domain-containing protein n=1 Tax=Mantoniella antarctica TaxID=81844 RepID=A0A7S0SXQ9_9CHLO